MDNFQDRVAAKGLEIFRLMEREEPAVFDKRRWGGMLMNAAMADPELKVRLFRFVDVLPTLTSTELIASHIREYFLDTGSPVPPLMSKLLLGIDSPLTSAIAARLVKKTSSPSRASLSPGRRLRRPLRNCANSGGRGVLQPAIFWERPHSQKKRQITTSPFTWR